MQSTILLHLGRHQRRRSKRCEILASLFQWTLPPHLPTAAIKTKTRRCGATLGTAAHPGMPKEQSHSCRCRLCRPRSSSRAPLPLLRRAKPPGPVLCLTPENAAPMQASSPMNDKPRSSQPLRGRFPGYRCEEARGHPRVEGREAELCWRWAQGCSPICARGASTALTSVRSLCGRPLLGPPAEGMVAQARESLYLDVEPRCRRRSRTIHPSACSVEGAPVQSNGNLLLSMSGHP